jgi:hypothetical protein
MEEDGASLYYESVDLEDAFHPQSILAYELNGEILPIKNGAPLRLRLERQLGYKMVLLQANEGPGLYANNLLAKRSQRFTPTLPIVIVIFFSEISPSDRGVAEKNILAGYPVTSPWHELPAPAVQP